MRKLLTFTVLMACILLSGICIAADYEVISLGKGSRPKWSPDGKYLSFLCSEGVKVYDVDSRAVRFVGPARSVYYDWLTPNELLFKHERNSKTKDGPIVIVEFVTFSVDGAQKVLYSESMPMGNYRTSRLHRLSNGELGISREDTVTVEQLSQMLGRDEIDTTAYYVTPFYKSREIWLMHADGRPYKRVVQKAYILPKLSPDGKYIACNYSRIMDVLDLDGDIFGSVDKAELPLWLSDSKRLVYTKTKEKDDDIVASEIFVVDMTGENEIQITDTPDKVELDPIISPDMTKIAYVNYASDANYIEILDLKEALK